MGLAHPHDTGGGSEVMHGVPPATSPPASPTGDFGLNEGIFTTMSYNDGWPDGPEGTSDSTAYGYQGTLWALDVAELQIKYGANTSYHTGNDTYAMPDVNAPGTMYACIWTRAATTRSGRRARAIPPSTSGGDAAIRRRRRRICLAHRWHLRGFTIANGVVIEDAKGAPGDDAITGNDANNHLDGAGGVDHIDGGDGNDTITGGAGADILTGGAGDDVFVYTRVGRDTITDLSDSDSIDLSGIDADINTTGDQRFAVVGHFSGHAGELVVHYVSATGTTRFAMDTDGDGTPTSRSSPPVITRPTTTSCSETGWVRVTGEARARKGRRALFPRQMKSPASSVPDEPVTSKT